jgi:hypothetical protein
MELYVEAFSSTVEATKISGGFMLKWSAMYSHPPINFGLLKELSDQYGTDDIDVDQGSSPGCDTCDYGSSYWHDIFVRNPTKNVDKNLMPVATATE